MDDQYPAAQFLQTEIVVAPTTVLCVPIAQLVHEFTELIPAMDDHVPAGHVTHVSDTDEPITVE